MPIKRKNQPHKMTIYHFKQKEKRIKEEIIHKENKSLADNIQEMKKLKDDLFEYLDTIFKNKGEQE